jgi:hypothetical protein
VPSGNTRTLTPFTKGDPRAVEAGRRSAAARKAKREAGAIVKVEDATAGANLIDTLTARYERDKLGAAAGAAVQHLIAKVISGEVPCKDATDVANLVKVLFDVARLEEGQATSHTLHASIDSAAIVARIEQLRHELGTPPAAIEA